MPTIIMSLLILMMIIGLMIDYNLESFIVILVVAPINLIYIATLLVAKFKKGMSYIFRTDSIEVYNKDKLQYTININDINTMRYYPFKWHYIVTIFAGALNEGGAWKIHITDYHNIKHSLGFISYEDAKKLKQMYPELEIMYMDKNKQLLIK